MNNTPETSSNGNAYNTGRRNNSWSKDGVNGGLSSLTILITWLSEERNYNRYRGGDGQNGQTKEAVCMEIVYLMTEN